MTNIVTFLRNRETGSNQRLLYEGDCEGCFYYWNLSSESRSEGQKTWISGRIHRIGPIFNIEKPIMTPVYCRFHGIKVEQSDNRTESVFKACPELKGTGYNNLVSCRRYYSVGPCSLYVVD
jgi:hypothetical protein